MDELHWLDQPIHWLYWTGLHVTGWKLIGYTGADYLSGDADNDYLSGDAGNDDGHADRHHADMPPERFERMGDEGAEGVRETARRAVP